MSRPPPPPRIEQIRSSASPVTSPPLPVPRPGSRAAGPPPRAGRTFFGVRRLLSRERPPHVVAKRLVEPLGARRAQVDDVLEIDGVARVGPAQRRRAEHADRIDQADALNPGGDLAQRL